MALSSDALSEIVRAILATPQFQFLTRLMRQQAAGANQGKSDRLQQFERMQACPAGHQLPTPPRVAENDRYAALAASQRYLARHLAEVSRSNAALERREVDEHRRARLADLAGRLPQFVDLAQEHERCLYSAGSYMGEDEFDDHCEMLEQYGARAVEVAPSRAVDQRDRWPRQTPEAEQYTAQVSARSVEIYDASVAAGRSKTADQCWAEAEQAIQGAA